MPVSFHSDGIPYRHRKLRIHREWIQAVIRRQRKKTGTIQFIFTSNASLLKMNQEYLNHNYFTDVITFDYSEGNVLSGDIFISIDQVRLNAREYGVKTGEELRRVMVHGVLHLMGFRDGTRNERERMREMENEALFLWSKTGGNESGV